jgi:MFS family permease
MALTLSGYLIGFRLSQLLGGPIGDRYGLRVPVAFGLVLFTHHPHVHVIIPGGGRSPDGSGWIDGKPASSACSANSSSKASQRNRAAWSSLATWLRSPAFRSRTEESL